MSMSTVKLGFIGTGGNAGWHMRDLSSLEGTRLVAFCDIVEERHNVAESSRDLQWSRLL